MPCRPPGALCLSMGLAALLCGTKKDEQLEFRPGTPSPLIFEPLDPSDIEEDQGLPYLSPEQFQAEVQNVEDVSTRVALGGLYAAMVSLRRLKESSKGYCGLDFQDRVFEAYRQMVPFLGNIELQTVQEQVGFLSPVVTMVQKAEQGFGQTIGRKTNLEILTRKYGGDTTAICNRYYG